MILAINLTPFRQRHQSMHHAIVTSVNGDDEAQLGGVWTGRVLRESADSGRSAISPSRRNYSLAPDWQ